MDCYTQIALQGVDFVVWDFPDKSRLGLGVNIAKKACTFIPKLKSPTMQLCTVDIEWLHFKRPL